MPDINFPFVQLWVMVKKTKDSKRINIKGFMQEWKALTTQVTLEKLQKKVLALYTTKFFLRRLNFKVFFCESSKERLVDDRPITGLPIYRGSYILYEDIIVCANVQKVFQFFENSLPAK